MVLSTFSLLNRPWKESFDMSSYAKNLFLNLDEVKHKNVDMSEVTFSELSFPSLWFVLPPPQALLTHLNLVS